ncbi:hypothetical protein H5410_003407 [Solanum commersonii]|uniref:Gag-pol polyprotein n=1 Tax=Solanum commersonii TaxID=4109 RepID=A0A9J6B507_SOLCO|nr:hypothetical protein H5410_003407 [Solanum commersonii]
MNDFTNENSQNFRARPTQSQGSVAQGANWTPTCAKRGRNHPGACCDGSNSCFNCEELLQGDPEEKTVCMLITSRQDQENSPDVLTGTLKVFRFDVYAMIDQGANLSFVTPYVAMWFDTSPQMTSEPFSVSIPIGESILA